MPLPVRIRRWLREPLVHFLAIGAALFLFFAWTGGGAPGSGRIVVGPGQVEHLAVTFSRTWQRPPTPAELKGLVDDYVREEIAVREARSMGLDRDDTVIRRRLRQKLEFLTEDAVESTPPTDTELRSWLDEHAADYRLDPEIAFRQVYLNPDRHADSLDADADRLLKRLKTAGDAADLSDVGDSIMLPAEVPLSPLRVIGRTFGEDFATSLDEVSPGAWTGPLRSGYGLHLVYVRERRPGRSPDVDEVKDALARDFVSDRRKRELESLYARLLERYDVRIEMPEDTEGPAAPGGSPAATAESAR